MAYLRVYEPLSAFGDPPDAALVDAVRSVKLDRTSAAQREHLMWLKSQLAAPSRLLPAELADGRPAPSTRTDVLVLDPSDIPEDGGSRDEPLVCPLELRARSAAALSGFLGDAHPALSTAVLTAGGVSADSVRARTTAAIGDLGGSAMHILSTTWMVPLPWFAVIDPDDRKLVLGDGPNDPVRELSWRANMTDARRRNDEARELVEDTFGESGPGRILAETGRWLENFDPASVVELDYGGLVQLVPDSMLATDSSAEEVHGILEALRTGEVQELAELFQDLRDYWAELAGRERFN